MDWVWIAISIGKYTQQTKRKSIKVEGIKTGRQRKTQDPHFPLRDKWRGFEQVLSFYYSRRSGESESEKFMPKISLNEDDELEILWSNLKTSDKERNAAFYNKQTKEKL